MSNDGWLQKIEDADKRERKWREDAERAEDLYSDEKGDVRFNILFSNTQTLVPALYNSTPRPDVRRRYRDKDAVGKIVCEIIERALAYSVDAYDFDDNIRQAILDYLLSGRGVIRVRYVPTYGDPVKDMIPVQAVTDPVTREFQGYMKDGETVESVIEGPEGPYVEGDEYSPVVHEEVICERVIWDDFRILCDARRWEEVTAIAFRHKMDREQLIAEFGEEGRNAPLNWKDEDDEQTTDKRAEVWEIWDKIKREVIFVSKGMDKPLDRRDDPLRLEGFFPIPRPIVSIRKPRSLVPKPEYYIYRAQAEELNKVSARIIKLTDAVKARFVYDPALGDALTRMFDSNDDGVMVPADPEAITRLLSMSGGAGFDRAIWAAPIDVVVAVLVQLVAQRESIKQTIYEITGISDILRGSTDPNETLGAQRIKAQYGSLRLTDRQQDVQRFIRDLFRIKAEIYAEHFSEDTLAMMTGINLPTQQEKAYAIASIQAQQPAPEAQQIAKSPTWPEVMEIMRSDMLRGYRIDVETDSTIQADESYDKRSLAELYKGIGDFLGVVGPAVQAGAMSQDAAKQLLLSAVRRFRFGRQVEDAIENDEGNKGPTPEQQAAQMEMQVKQAEGQARMAEIQGRTQLEQVKAQGDIARMQAEGQLEAEKIQIAREELQIKREELEMKRSEMVMKMQVAAAQHAMKLDAPQ